MRAAVTTSTTPNTADERGGSLPRSAADRLVAARREVWSALFRLGREGKVGDVRAVETILFLVVLGTVVAAFAGRLSIPAPSLLVIVGLVPGVPAVHVPPDVVSLVVLPPLLYAASEELPWRDLLAVWRPVLVLAVGLVLASAAAGGGEAGVRARGRAGQHGSGGGQRAGAAALAAAEGAGAGAGGEPVQRRDQPGAVPDRGLVRGRRDSRPGRRRGAAR